MVLRLLPLTLFIGATSVAAQVPARVPTRVPTVVDTVAATRAPAGWFGFRQDVLRDSLVVLEVAPGSPAERAGLRPGDRIAMVDGRAANPSLLNERPATVGDVRRLTVRRGSQTLTLSMVAEVPPRRVLMPSRVALTDADTVAREAQELRGRMALRATRAARTRAIIDTVRATDVAQTERRLRVLRSDSTRTIRAMIEPLIIVDGVPLLTDTVLHNELRSGTRATDSARARRVITDTLYDGLVRATREQNATLARLLRHSNAVSGAEFEELNPGLAEYFYGVSEGVFVLRVAETTPAASAGLRPGDIVQDVNGQRITTVNELRSAVSEASGTIVLRVLRKGSPATITLRKE